MDYSEIEKQRILIKKQNIEMGGRIRRARKFLGIKIDSLASDAGISAARLRQYEMGEYIVDDGLARTLTRLLKLGYDFSNTTDRENK